MVGSTELPRVAVLTLESSCILDQSWGMHSTKHTYMTETSVWVVCVAVYEPQQDEKKYEDNNEDGEENLPPVNLKRYNSSSVAFSPINKDSCLGKLLLNREPWVQGKGASGD